MTELGNIFAGLDEEKDIYFKIKHHVNGYLQLDANISFKYFLYSSIYLYSRGEDIIDGVLEAIVYFIAKEQNLSNSIAVIGNTYQITAMQDAKFISQLLMGLESNFLKLNSDAAMLGALMALAYKVYDIKKIDILKKALLLAKSVL